MSIEDLCSSVHFLLSIVNTFLCLPIKKQKFENINKPTKYCVNKGNPLYSAVMSWNAIYNIYGYIYVHKLEF